MSWYETPCLSIHDQVDRRRLRLGGAPRSVRSAPTTVTSSRRRPGDDQGALLPLADVGQPQQHLVGLLAQP
jgi:hypothetical protein